MDAGEALDELTRLSAEIESAAILDLSGAVRATTPDADPDRLARAAAELLDVAAVVHPERTVDRVDVRLSRGAVFVVQAGGHVAVATTGPDPPAALVAHDLRACLGRLGAAPFLVPERDPTADPVDA